LPAPQNDLDISSLSEALLLKIVALKKRGVKARDIEKQVNGLISWQKINTIKEAQHD